MPSGNRLDGDLNLDILFHSKVKQQQNTTGYNKLAQMNLFSNFIYIKFESTYCIHDSQD